MFLSRNGFIALENKQTAPLSCDGTVGTLGSHWGDDRRAWFQLHLNQTLPGTPKPKYRNDRRNVGL